MDLRDYLLLLRRGALTIAVAAALASLLALLYLQVTPKVYQSSAAVLVSPHNPRNMSELQVGGQYAVSAAPTIATLIGTAAVLRAAADDLRGEGAGAGLSVSALQGMVSASSVEASAVVNVTASASDASLAAAIANAVASRAASEVPDLTSARETAGAPLLELQVIQAARTPGAPTSPNSKRVIVLFDALGLALGLALTLLRQSLDNRLRRSEDVTGMTQLPLLATIARRQRGQRAGIVVRDAPASPAVEGYRVLRTNLRALATDNRGSVLVAAASHDPTALHVPTNLAWSLAQTGLRVLLVDLDLRQAAIAALFGHLALDSDDSSSLPDSAGAADVLTGDADFRQVVRHTSLPSLDLLPAGVAVQAPSDLLSGTGLPLLVDRAEAEYDYVVIHAPALLRYTDAAVVARAVSQTVIVVRGGYTKAPDLTQAIGVLTNVGVAPLGVVLSDGEVSVAINLRAREAWRPALPQRSARMRRSGGGGL